MTEKSDTRTRILDVAEAAVLEKGFEATSIEEIVAGADISRGGFFYHFKDKNALARAMLERYIETEDRLYDDLFARARELHQAGVNNHGERVDRVIARDGVGAIQVDEVPGAAKET